VIDAMLYLGLGFVEEARSRRAAARIRARLFVSTRRCDSSIALASTAAALSGFARRRPSEKVARLRAAS